LDCPPRKRWTRVDGQYADSFGRNLRRPRRSTATLQLSGKRRAPDPSQPERNQIANGGSRKSQSDHLPSDTPFGDHSPNRTTLFPKKTVPSPTPYWRGIIGRLDVTLDPMILPGSIVQIDTRNLAISSRKNWTHEFQRPVCFLRTREGRVCLRLMRIG
jgi:hypothetical protein